MIRNVYLKGVLKHLLEEVHVSRLVLIGPNGVYLPWRGAIVLAILLQRFVKRSLHLLEYDR